MVTKPTFIEKVPPHNLEAEESLLGAMLISRDAIAEAQEIVKAEDFYRQSNSKIFDAIMELYIQGEPADPITLAEALKKKGILEDVGGKLYIHTLISGVPTAANARHYAEIVGRNATLRNLIRAATEIAALGYEVPEDLEAAIDRAESLIFGVSRKRVSERFIALKDLCTETWEHIEKLAEAGVQVTGLATGFGDLDQLTSGLQRSDLIVVAGRPSMGKTSFVLSIAQNVALNLRVPVAIFSLEMSRSQLAQRFMSSEARVNAQNLRTGNLKDEDLSRLVSALDRLSEAPIFVDDSPSISSVEIRAKARRLMAKYELGLVIVDYLQLMQGSRRAENRQQEISEISRSLKILGRELSIPIIAVSQLSRGVEQRGGDKRPLLADLRESGAIEQDADLVIFIYRDELYNSDTDDRGVAEVIIRKHRNGPVGTVRLAFLEHYTKFANLAPEMTE
jgi:replicative DNA helicase